MTAVADKLPDLIHDMHMALKSRGLPTDGNGLYSSLKEIGYADSDILKAAADHDKWLQFATRFNGDFFNLILDSSGGRHYDDFLIDGAPAASLRLNSADISEPLATREHHIELTERLITEAVALKSGVIPPNAFVEIHIGDYIGVHLHEFHNTVFMAWESAKGDFFLCCFDETASNCYFYWPIVLPSLQERDRNFSASVQQDVAGEAEKLQRFVLDAVANDANGSLPCAPAQILQGRVGTRRQLDSIYALRCLSAAIIRDFWVIEDRSSFARLGAPRTKRFRSHNRPVVRTIYLPRARYDRSSIIRCASSGIGEWTVSPHWVRSHFRTLPAGAKATDKQKAIASFNGVRIDEGQTWVRGHSSGHGTTDTIFRSRSATTALMQNIGSSPKERSIQGLNWFEFQLLCEDLLRSRGLSIIDKVGDGGIDILAVDEKGAFVRVECKHWEKAVGPGVVRAAAGSATSLPTGVTDAKSIVMSSSGFTAGARVEAAKSGTELILVRATDEAIAA